MVNRTLPIPAILILAVLALTGCKASTNTAAPIVRKQETYSIEITDYSAFNAKTSLAEQLNKQLSEDDLAEENELRSADWPMRLLLTNSPVQQLAHSDLGSPPIPVPLDPISVLINAGYFLGWSVKEAGKQAVNAGTPNYIVRMRLHILTPDGTAWRIDDEIPLYTLDKEKSRQRVAREASDKIEVYLAAFRAGDTVESAVEETNPYELEQLRGTTQQNNSPTTENHQ
ncbi:hypothetical protein [Pseudodesulfovibrio methanolicus]|uniref:DUF4136 domain-containing protein n=1 Tax=Pseudodesulfovibrio methanolicus TaxID=3126690 RepID=A0ABZ2IWC8_9BACT